MWNKFGMNSFIIFSYMLVLRLCTLTIVEYGNRWEINLTLWTAGGGESFIVVVALGLRKYWLHLLKSLRCYLLSVEEILRWLFYWHVRNLAIFPWLFRLFSFVNPERMSCLTLRVLTIHFFIQKIFIECLLCAGPTPSKHWRCSTKKKKALAPVDFLFCGGGNTQAGIEVK